MGRTTSRRRWTALAVLGLAASVFAACDPLPPATPEVNPGDGASAETAGASCWGIKQAHPGSADGVYWVYNAVQDRPIQVRCDMTTQGGGWVLVGRGREGWNFLNRGQGTEADLRNTVDGPAAFPVDTLPTATVTELLGGVALDDLPDGIRVQRATDAAGTTYQELRLHAAYPVWSWGLWVGKRLTSVEIDGTTYANGNTRDTALDYYDYPASPLLGVQGLRRLTTQEYEENGWLAGWSYGSGVTGTDSDTTHRYRIAGPTMPFTRVWLRPRISNGSVVRAQIPALGYRAKPNPPNLEQRHERSDWGVVGLNHTNEPTIEPWNTTVSVIKVRGTRAFVGGRFTHVQQGPSGPSYAQQSLAAFDLDGNWIPSFDPQIAGRVWDMTFTDDGKLIIGGDFTSVDGHPNTSGLAALDPATGEVITSWKGNVWHATSTHIVRGLDHRDGWIYAIGRFNRVDGGSWATLNVSSAVSLRASDGQPGTWRPRLSGTGVRVRAAAAGDRVYLAGYFNAVNGDTNHGYHGITNASDGTPVAGIGPWLPSDPPGAKYQQAVAEVGDRILVGGAQHDFQMYDRNRTSLLESYITRTGGDFQTIEVYEDGVYAGCHCADRIFLGANDFPTPVGFRDIEPMTHIARFDPVTLEFDETWNPDGLRGLRQEGVWTNAKDSRGCLWIGGDLLRGPGTGNAANDWLGGFARYCPTDSTSPTQPRPLQLTSGPGGVDLSWGVSTDAGGGIRYDVIRNGRVIATVTGRTYHDDLPAGTVAHYAVRAVDAAGNESPSTAPQAGSVPAENAAPEPAPVPDPDPDPDPGPDPVVDPVVVDEPPAATTTTTSTTTPDPVAPDPLDPGAAEPTTTTTAPPAEGG